ncbi:TonB-dependent receptor [Zoogloea sp.]|uniref:TonB-dependent receptor n=1 Tax=Zoogloea sp. TaxID=49181 RepID=UPI0035AE449C
MQAPARRPSFTRCRTSLHPLVLALAAAFAAQAQAQQTQSTVTPTVVVVGQTPLPGLDLPVEQIPAPVQTVSAAQLQESTSLDISSYMSRRMNGVHVNEIQGNPFQMDVNYRGYTASPLLGTPQGLSVYLDGVRINQPFGDVVSWDLIPKAAIANMNLMPGSNPLFGLNTLGGALAIQTKEGRTHPGTVLETGVGSYGRRQVTLEHGGFNEQGLEWFFTANKFHERGWRDTSPSDVRQVFGKVGWQSARTDLDLTVSYADNQLHGNGLQEVRFLDQDYGSVYTKPDITTNRNLFLNLSAKHSISDNLLAAGNVYYRKINTTTYNGDVNEGALDQSIYQPSAAERAALKAAGYSGYPTSGANASNTPFPYWRCVANALLNDEPNEKCTGVIHRTRTDQENLGMSGQLTWLGDIAGLRNQATLGAGFDMSNLRFQQSAQYGYITADRSIVPVNAYADGTQTSENVEDARVRLNGRTRTWSVFASDTLSLTDKLTATVAGRYNQSVIKNQDLLNPGGGIDSLDGNHTYQRFNPAIGFTYSPAKTLNTYLGYSEGSRTPTAVELGCANPDNPCRLPNAMAGDPPLKQVVTRTWDAGVRGQIGNRTFWNAGVFRSDNRDDILFVASDTTGSGYFKNFGKTRRQGVELGGSTGFGPLSIGLQYTYLDATYQSTEEVNGSANSSNEEGNGLEGNITIRPGNRIPLIPKHIAKLALDYQATSSITLGLDMIGVSGSYARGNENNQHQADGVYYLGSGKSGGYAVTNLSARYQATPKLQVFGQINNLFDREYSTAAQLGATAFSSSGGVVARPFASVGGEYPLVHSTFQAPGAPRTLWVGLRYSL